MMDPGEAPPLQLKRSVGFWVALISCVAFSAVHVAGIFTESVNWDEFGLLRRAQNAVSNGYLQPGGRPGLGVIALMPLVAGCTDAIENVRLCRLVWSIFGLGYPAGLFLLLRRFLCDVRATSEGAAWDAFAALPLLVLVPLWLRWSIQVRTDQPALFFVLLAGYFVLLSRQRASWAALGGLFAAVAFLFTQKAAYAGLIVAILALVHTLSQPFDWKRLLARTVFFVVPAVLTFVLFQTMTQLLFEQPPADGLGSTIDHNAYYRDLLGYKLYRYVLPYMIPHGILAGGLILTSVPPLIRSVGRKPELIAAWLVLGAGGLVGWFHGSTFSYFWMTIGLFPATAAALTLGSVRAALYTTTLPRWIFRGLYALAGGWLVHQSLSTMKSIANDSQAAQRAAYSFIEANFGPDEIGYHPEGGLYCREPKSPFPLSFSIHIYLEFFVENPQENAQAFIDKFKTVPVAFILHSFRILQFPPKVTDFLNENYLRYSPSVSVPGKRVEPGFSETEIFVPGTYKWESEHSASLLIGDTLVPSGRTIDLERGTYQLETTSLGALVRAMEGQPGSRVPFYGRDSVMEVAPDPVRRAYLDL